MNNQLFSDQWYRVADLKPKLKSNVAVHRQIQRRKVWYLLHDKVSGRTHRLDMRTYRIVAQLGGDKTVNDLWLATVEANEHDAPTQQDVIQLVSQLHQADLIHTDITPDVEEIFQRQEKRKRKRQMSLVNPLSFRAPLFNPSNLLAYLEPLGRLMSHRIFLFIWFAITGLAATLALMHWNEILNHGRVHLQTPHYWLLIWFVYPIVKAVHEIAHGLLVRRFGGEVNELGISLLVLMPVPYVNASEASTFKSKWHRIAVSAAGIMAELLLASLALLLWLQTSDGLLRDIAFITMTIGGVSTLLFNGNPLLKLDGYYVLSDLLEIPNLAQQAKKQWSYLARKYLLRAEQVIAPTATRSESRWLTGYGAAAWIYRIGITFLIATFFADISLLLAAGIVVFMLYTVLLKPIYEIFEYLRHSQEISRHRFRSWIIVAIFGSAVLAIIAFAPLPYYTMAQGVVWLPEKAEIRSRSEGFVRSLYSEDGSTVSAGDLIMVLKNPELNTRIAEADAHLVALRSKLSAAGNTDLVKANKIRDEIAAAHSALDKLIAEKHALNVRAGDHGRLVVPNFQDMQDRYVARGDVLAYVIPQDNLKVRTVIRQKDEELVRHLTENIEVILSERPDRSYAASMSREIPASTLDLPSLALAVQNGGTFVTDPADNPGSKSLHPVFVVDLELADLATQRVGSRVWVRFNHGNTPLLQQWKLKWRQLFLQHITARS